MKQGKNKKIAKIGKHKRRHGSDETSFSNFPIFDALLLAAAVWPPAGFLVQILTNFDTNGLKMIHYPASSNFPQGPKHKEYVAIRTTSFLSFRIPHITVKKKLEIC